MRRGLRHVLIVGLAIAAAGCGARARPAPTKPATVTMGACASPERDGVLGASPDLEHADRDLDGDGQPEAVVSDQNLCSPEGNCHWNLFSQRRGCWRYLGTVSAAGIEALPDRGEGGYRDLAGWWRFGDDRALRQEFSFRYGGYRLIDTLLCREQEDDRILCAPDQGSEGGQGG